jgi:8-oxo-dGTP diphosphatase
MGREEQKSPGRRYLVVPRVLCFLFSGQEVLLLKGCADKDLWPNQYNGIGGHLETGEDMVTAAQREIAEETGLTVHDLRLRGVVTVDVEPEAGVLIGVFTARADSRHFVDSAEGQLAWFAIDELPLREIVPDVPQLLHKLMGDSPGEPPFSARYSYDAANELVIQFTRQS